MNLRANKFLIALVLILIVANFASIALFWIKDVKPPAMQPRAIPAEFLVKQLQLTTAQQQQFETLKKEHQKAASTLRKEIKDSKEELFELLKIPEVNDSVKNAAVKKISLLTEQIDLVTFNHFEKVRAICNITQQKKFDEIIKEVTRMMAPQGPPHRGEGRPPRGDFDDGAPHEKRGD